MKRLLMLWMSCMILAGIGKTVSAQHLACEFEELKGEAENPTKSLSDRQVTVNRIMLRGHLGCADKNEFDSSSAAADTLRKIVADVAQTKQAMHGEIIRRIESFRGEEEPGAEGILRQKGKLIEMRWQNDPHRDEIILYTLNAYLDFVAKFPGIGPNKAESRANFVDNFAPVDDFISTNMDLSPEILSAVADHLKNIEDDEHKHTDRLGGVLDAIRDARYGAELMRYESIALKYRNSPVGKAAKKTASFLYDHEKEFFEQSDLIEKSRNSAPTPVLGAKADSKLKKESLPNMSNSQLEGLSIHDRPKGVQFEHPSIHDRPKSQALPPHKYAPRLGD